MCKLLFDISMAPLNPKMFKLGFLLFHNSYGVLDIDFDGTIFNTYAVVSKANPHNKIGISVKHIMDLTMSNKVQFLLFATPFNYGIYGGFHYERIPFSLR